MPDFARAQLRRQRINFGLFLGPALLLLFVFFIAPIVIDLVLAFTDMGRTLKVGVRLGAEVSLLFQFLEDVGLEAAGAGHFLLSNGEVFLSLLKPIGSLASFVLFGFEVAHLSGGEQW